MLSLRSSCASFVAALVLSAATHADTYTVDDDGPANFSSISAAIASVPPGSVLLVMPGTYDAFVDDKPLTILGPGDGPRPRVLGATIIKASSFTLAGLSLENLTVDHVDGPSRIDDCVLGEVTANYAAGLVITTASQLLVTRSVMDGRSPLPGDGGVPGALILHATFALVDCSVFGGDAADADPNECANPSHGAAYVANSNGQFAACSLVGGHGGITNCIFGSEDSPSGYGLTLQMGHDDLRGGTTLSAGPYFLGWEGAFGFALDVTGVIAVLEPSTVGTGGLHKGASTLITADVPEPTLLVSADTPQVPGGFGQLTWSAPAGAPGLLLAGLIGSADTLPQWEGTLWVSLPTATVLPLVAGAGPTTLDDRIPPGDELIGTVITLQAVFPTVPGAQHPDKAAISNPAQLVIRF